MLIVRILAIIIGAGALYTTHLNFKRKVFNKIEFSVWFFIWFGLLGLALTPGLIYKFLSSFDSVYIADLLMIVAFVVIYLIGFYTHILFRKQYNAVEQIVRELAIINRDKSSDQRAQTRSTDSEPANSKQTVAY